MAALLAADMRMREGSAGVDGTGVLPEPNYRGSAEMELTREAGAILDEEARQTAGGQVLA